MADQSEMSNVEQEGNEEFYQILSDFIKRRDAGEDVDVEDLCKQHPQHAGALRSYAAGDGLLNAMLGGDADEQISPHLRSSQSVSAHAVETVRPGASQATDTPMKEQFGRYRVVRILGEGAMGSIYLAEDTNLEREVALKIPKLTGMEGADFLQRFSREAKAAARLDHPFICRVYDADEHEGTPFITMAYIDGQPLSRFIGTPEFDDQRRVAEMIRDIADGLEHAHQQQILHRDLKPGNVLVQIDGTPCITDFGLARRVDTGEESRITKEGAIIGTPAYMSPEQIEGHQDRIHSAADIYSLGVIFYELLTKQLPFQGSVMSILGQAMRDRPKPLSKIRSDVDSDLEQLCLKMLEKRPQDRPASMQEIVDELGKWLEKTPEDQQAADAKAKRRIAQLEDSKSKIKDLIERGQYAAALRRLEKLAVVTHPIAQEYVEWAKAKLPEVQAMPEKLQKGLPSLIASANKFISRNDYAQAADLLSKIPANQRNDEAQRLLDKAIDLQDEADLLLADLKDCVKRRQYKGIMENLDRFLELKPGNKFANDLHRALTSYGTGKRRKKKFRFDERGKLLPAQSDSIWDSFALWGAVAFLAVFGLVSWGIMIYLGDSGQKLAVEIDEQWLAEQGGKITLAVDGKEHTITGPGIDIKVALGKRGFSVKNGDTVVYNPETFTIEKEGRKILRIDATGMHFGTGGSNLDPDNENIARATNGQTETAITDRKVTGRQIAAISEKVGKRQILEFSPDGSRLASFNWNTAIYDVEKAELIGREKWGNTWDGCWHPNDGQVICALVTGEVQYFNSASFQRVKQYRAMGNLQEGGMFQVAVSGDGKHIAYFQWKSPKKKLEIIDTETNELLISIDTEKIDGLHFDDARKRLLSVSNAKQNIKVHVVNLDDKSVKELPVNVTTSWPATAYSTKYDRLYITDVKAAGTAAVLNATTGEQIGMVGETRRGSIRAIAVTDSADIIALANSETNTVELVDQKSLRAVGEIDLDDLYANGLAFDGPGQRLAAFCVPKEARRANTEELQELAGSIRIFELSESNTSPVQSENIVNAPRTPLPDGPPGLLKELVGHTGKIIGLKSDPTGQFLYSISEDQTLQKWNIESGQSIWSTTLDARPSSLSLHPSGEFVLAGTTDHARIYSAETGKQIQRLRQNPEYSHRATFSTSGSQIATLADDGVRIWNFRNGEIEFRDSISMEVPFNLGGLAFTPDDKKLLVARNDDSGKDKSKRTGLRLFDLESKQEIRRYLEPDSKFLFRSGGDDISVSADGIVAIKVTDIPGRGWDPVLLDIETGRMIAHPPAQGAPVFSPDGRFVAIGSNKEFYIVDLKGQIVWKQETELHSSSRLAFTPDQRFLFSAGGWFWNNETNKPDQDDVFNIQVWRLPEEVWPKTIDAPNVDSPKVTASAIESQIRQSLILNKPTGSSKSPGISVVTAKGICTVRAGSFKTVELSVEGDTKTIEGKVASRRPFPFCWIDADDLSPFNRKAVSEAKPDALKGGDTAYIAYKRTGKVHVHKGTITEFGAFKADFEYSPTQRGIVQVGPVFTTEGKLAGYGVRMDLGNDIKIYRIRRE